MQSRSSRSRLSRSRNHVVLLLFCIVVPLLKATHGERIVLNISDLDIAESEACEQDYLEIRDGYWPKSPLLGNFGAKIGRASD